MRLMLCCASARTLPTVIVATASTQSSIDQSACRPPKPRRKTRVKAANPALFTATAMSAVTDVGAPSYTSGVHMWNGTAATLKPNATSSMATPARSRWRSITPPSLSAITSMRVAPVAP